MPTCIQTIGRVVLAVLLLTGLSAAGAQTPLEQQRQDFSRAEQALAHGDRARFERLLASLENYPLYPYLVYEDVRERMASVSAAEIHQFLKAYDDTPLAWQLRHAWLRHLARNRQWQQYREDFRSTSRLELRCYHRQALLHTDAPEQALAGMDELWLHGFSLPDSCDPVLDYWRKQGGLTQELAWGRIGKAMAAGNHALVRYLARFVDREDRRWVDAWHNVHHHPRRIWGGALDTAPESIAHRIRYYGLTRLARREPQTLIRRWQDIDGLVTLSSRESGQLTRKLALRLAYRRAPQALEWLQRVPDTHADARVRQWRVRAALAVQDWDAALESLAALPARQQQEPRWLYWKARALEALGRRGPALAVYQRAAEHRGYEGFLAADRLGSEYRFEDRSLAFSQDQLSALRRVPGIARARELFHHGDMLDARREWYSVTRDMDEGRLQQAALLAHDWGWHDRAIITLGKSSYRDDLQVRFPVLHLEHIRKHSQATGIEPAWALAVIRRESAFNSRARSPRGAMGLMQLMPATARHVTRAIQVGLRGTDELLQASFNIKLGMSYLDMVLERFNRHPVLALAAYNAGSHRVDNWLPDQERTLPADIWVETVPFTETRNYLRAILAYTAIYEKRIGHTPTRLSDRMPPVPSPATSISEREASQRSG